MPHHRLLRPALLFAIASLTAAAPHRSVAYGGWAVVTVENLPDHIVAGRPLSLSYTIRQHGRTPLGDLKGSLEARSGSLEARAYAIAGKQPGQYFATLTLPRSGEWTITIHSGFWGSGDLTLLPISVIDSGSPAPLAFSDAERGQRLFIAKGCVTCHEQGRIGPDLRNRRFEADYLKRFLADPAATIGQRTAGVQMPNLNLKQTEIAALTAFINSDRQQALR